MTFIKSMLDMERIRKEQTHKFKNAQRSQRLSAMFDLLIRLRIVDDVRAMTNPISAQFNSQMLAHFLVDKYYKDPSRSDKR
jgi:hypothetical protein